MVGNKKMLQNFVIIFKLSGFFNLQYDH